MCGHRGVAAEPCAGEICARFELHCVPEEHLPRDIRSRDPVIGRLLGDYLVVRRLGAGGVGSVYLALQQPIGLPAAVKLLHGEPSSLATPERFRQEAAALARLNHPNIVRLLKYGLDGPTPYLVMEYVEDGRTLADAMRAGLTDDDALRILLQICHGLEAAHRRSVVHRDIKPANVMLQAVPGEAHFVRLVDFGLAKFVDEGQSTRLAAGTPQYMAPEQARATGIGPWTDVYAVAVVACEMLMGRHPFPGDSAQSLILRKCDPSFDPVAALGEPVGPAMADFLRRSLATSPTERVRSMPALAGALRAVIAERARDGSTLPPTAPAGFVDVPLEPTGSELPIRKRPGGFAALAAVALLLVGLGVFSVIESDPPLPAIPVTPKPAVAMLPVEAPLADVPRDPEAVKAGPPVSADAGLDGAPRDAEARAIVDASESSATKAATSKPDRRVSGQIRAARRRQKIPRRSTPAADAARGAEATAPPTPPAAVVRQGDQPARTSAHGGRDDSMIDPKQLEQAGEAFFK